MKTKDGIKNANVGVATDLRHCAQLLFPAQPESSELTVEVPKTDYSASAIARAVEDADAHLLNLNVTSRQPISDQMVSVDIRINHRNGGSVARSLERYGFRVTDIHSGFDADSELTRERIEELLRGLEV
ncbi:MAG: hypothetical protein NC111_00740 [Bacteroides sp.]|nr:hypothetical protein [Bacteroides sp.]MCM1413846.1 hypothetical protein [Bacteroides sp.]MCM1471045.1 hypothetical protein [Bacteroides sp.]